MRVLVCGDRDFSDRDFFVEKMEEIAAERSKYYNPDDNWLPQDIHIISGGARGADQMAADWAVVNWCPFTEYHAEWDKYGKRAGFIRNKQMLDEGQPDLVIAFPGGKGTAMMVRIAKEAGVEVIDFNEE